MTTATRPLTVPAHGLTHTAGNLVATLLPMAQTGYRIQARVGGEHRPELCSTHAFETHALAAWAALVEQHPASPAPVVPVPGNVGTITAVSDPSHRVLMLAAGSADGHVDQGGQPGQATRTQLRSLAKKGYVSLVFEAGRRDARKVITGAVITSEGRRRLAQLDAADVEAARIAAAVTGRVAVAA